MSPIDITKEHNLVIISRSPRIHRIQSRDWYRQRFFTEHWFRMKRAKIRAQEAFQRIKRKKRNATPSFPPPPPLPFIPHISSLFLPFLEKKPALWRAPEDNRGPRTIVGANQSRIEFRPSSFPRWFHTRGRETQEKGDGSRLEIRGSARREAEKRKGWGWRRRRRSSPRPKIRFIGSRVTRFSGNLILRSVARTRPRFNDKRLKGRKLWCHGYG